MNLFYKRPLSLILCVLLGGFVFSAYFTGSISLFFGIGLFAAALLLLFLSRLLKFKVRFIATVLLFGVLGMMLSTLYFSFYFTTERFPKGEVQIEGVIESIKKYDDGSAISTLRVTKADGEQKEANFSAYFEKEDAIYLFEGAIVSFTGEITDFTDATDFSDKTYHYSNSVLGEIINYKSLRVTGTEEESLSDRIHDLNENISRGIIMAMGEDAGSLFSALFMGNRSYLSPRINLNFKRIGISHILALSGLHLTILALGISALLSAIGVSKKPRTLIILFLTLGYMTLTGFSPSVVRAGIMLIISSLLYLLSSMRDSLTNLSLAVFIICIFNPTAIFDLSLWLSAFATLGIIAFSEHKRKRKAVKSGIFRRFLSWVLISLLSSTFAIGATVLISSGFAGTVSVLSAFSTLIFSFIIEIFIYLGLLILPLGLLLPIGEFIMSPLSWLIDSFSDLLSSSKAVLLSTEGIYTQIAIYSFTVLFFLYLILNIRKKKAALASLFGMFFLIYAFAAIDTYTAIYKDEAVYASPEEKHDIILAKEGGDSAVIDVSRYAYYNTADTLEFLNNETVYSLDAYIISHYSFSLTDYLDSLISKVKIDTVLLPEAKCEYEISIYKKLSKQLGEHKVNIATYEIGDEIKVGNITVVQTHREIYGENTMKNAFSIKLDDRKIAYLGSGMLYYKTRDLAEKMIYNSDTVIFGAHGKTYSPSYEFYTVYPELENIIISGKKIYLSDKAMERYKENGTEVKEAPGTVRLKR